MARTRPWEVSEEWWEKVKPLIPPAPLHAKGGRPRMEDRKAFAAIIYVLRTGIHLIVTVAGQSSSLRCSSRRFHSSSLYKSAKRELEKATPGMKNTIAYCSFITRFGGGYRTLQSSAQCLLLCTSPLMTDRFLRFPRKDTLSQQLHASSE